MTFLTGELFNSIKMSASIRSVITIEEYDEHAFNEGVRISRTPGGLSHHIFSIRSRLVSRESSFGTYSSYLSGLLIGTEIAAGLEEFSHTDTIVLVGNSSLIHHYRKAFSQFDVDIESIDSEQASVMGLWKIAYKSKSINLNVA